MSTEKLGPHELIQSFLSGLSDFISTLVPSAGRIARTRTILFTSGTTAIQSWVADANYYVTGVTANTTSVQVLSNDGTPSSILTGADKVWAIGVIVAQNFSGTVLGMRHFVGVGSKLYWAPAASSEYCNVFLEYA